MVVYITLGSFKLNSLAVAVGTHLTEKLFCLFICSGNTYPLVIAVGKLITCTSESCEITMYIFQLFVFIFTEQHNLLLNMCCLQVTLLASFVKT